MTDGDRTRCLDHGKIACIRLHLGHEYLVQSALGVCARGESNSHPEGPGPRPGAYASSATRAESRCGESNSDGLIGSQMLYH